MNPIWEIGLPEFLVVTVVLGGGAAYPTGRAIAGTWRPLNRLVLFAVLLTVAVRFIHFALFQGTFFGVSFGADGSVSWTPLITAIHYALNDFVIIFAIAALGYQVTRRGQMTGQYSWLFERSGLFSWRSRASGEN